MATAEYRRGHGTHYLEQLLGPDLLLELPELRGILFRPTFSRPRLCFPNHLFEVGFAQDLNSQFSRLVQLAACFFTGH